MYEYAKSNKYFLNVEEKGLKHEQFFGFLF